MSLFEGRYRTSIFAYQQYDVSPDIQWFMMITDSFPDEIHVVENWFSDLQARVPTGR